MIETIRPTMSMVRDLLPGMKESWIFNDCAIGENKSGNFIALIVVRVDDGELYYGFQRNLHRRYSSYKAIHGMLDDASEAFTNHPDVFDEDISWTYVKEGNRYVYP